MQEQGGHHLDRTRATVRAAAAARFFRGEGSCTPFLILGRNQVGNRYSLLIMDGIQVDAGERERVEREGGERKEMQR